MGGAAGASRVPGRLESWIAEREAVDRWLRRAKPGELMVYAVMARLPARSRTAARMRALEQAGMVRLHAPALGDGLFEYQAIRRAGSPPPAVTAAPASRMTGDMVRVLNVLRRCVRLNRPCPTNRAIGKETGVHNAAYQFAKLIEAGIITSEIVDPTTGARVVTMCATGRQTAMPARPGARA